MLGWLAKATSTPTPGGRLCTLEVGSCLASLTRLSLVGKLVQDNRYCRRRTQRLIASGQERVLVSVQSLFICKRGFRIFCLLLITFEVATWRFVVRFSPSRSKTRSPCECFGAIVSAPAELMQGAIAERELRDQEAERLRITGWPSSLSILIFKGGGRASLPPPSSFH